MSKVTFETKDGSVTVNSEDMPKIAEKIKEKTKAFKEANQILKNAIDRRTEDFILLDSREMKRKYQINKINVTKEAPHYLTVKYGGANSKGSKDTTFTGFEELLDNDFSLIQSLVPHVCEILEFPEEWIEDITVTGISLNYDIENDNALRGMVVTMQKGINSLNCPLNINTPFIKFGAYIDEYCQFPPNESTWGNPVNVKILIIIDNAFKYMCGNSKVMQQKLL